MEDSSHLRNLSALAEQGAKRFHFWAGVMWSIHVTLGTVALILSLIVPFGLAALLYVPDPHRNRLDLDQVSTNHNISIRKKDPSMSDYNDLLKNTGVFDVPTGVIFKGLATSGIFVITIKAENQRTKWSTNWSTVSTRLQKLCSE